MRRRARMAVAAPGALGAVLLVTALLSPAAGADDLAVFGAQSVARGVEATLGPRNIVIDPLAQVAAPYTRTELNSIPQSNALASVLYPGDLAQAVLDEEGTAGNSGLPFSWPFTLKARLDRDRDKRDRVKAYPRDLFTERYGVQAQGGYMRALAEPGENRARAAETRLVVQPDPKSAPLVEVAGIEAGSESFVSGGRIVQRTVSRAKDVRLLDDTVRISTIVSTALAVSDGAGIPEIHARTEIGRVEVLDTRGKGYRAVIDARGIHVRDPSLSRSAEQSLDAALQITQRSMGVSITTQGASTISDGAAASASAGGVVITFSALCEGCRNLIALIPPEVSRLPQLPPEVMCALSTGRDSPLPDTAPRPLPFCIGPALVPIPPNLAGSITIAAARSDVSASRVLTFDGTGASGAPGGSSPGTLPGGMPPGGAGTGGPFAPPGSGAVPGGAAQPPVVSQPGGGPLYGLVSEIPSGALAGAGAALLVLAVALGFAPWLRRGTTA